MQTQKSRVLVIEDEADVRDLIVLHLKRDGYEVTAVDDGEKALKVLDTFTPDLAVVDWMLPGMSGLDVTKWLRDGGNGRGHVGDQALPILMVTARADSADIVRGLESGADDYVTKPFEIPVFLARVRSLLRRAKEVKAVPTAGEAGPKRLRVGSLELDVETYDVVANGERLQLTPSEFKLLKALMQNQGRVLSRDRLIELVQGEGVTVVDRAIDTHIFGLRKKLGNHADFVETIRGVGYRMKTGE